MAKKLRVGVLSAGAWSVATHIPELQRHDDVELVIVTNQDLERASKIKEIFGFSRSSNSWEEALKEELDVVIVSSPPIAHEKMVIAALESGAHVLCEKPFALTRKSAVTMTDTAKRVNRKLLVGYGWPFSDIFQRTHQLLAENIVGNVEFVSMAITSNIRELLLGHSTPDWSTQGILSEAKTYSDPRIAGGGALGTTLSHSLGLLIHLTGDSFEWIFGSSFPEKQALDFHESVSGRLKGGASVNMTCVSTFGSSPHASWHFEVYGPKGEIRTDTLSGTINYYGGDGDSWEENFDEKGRGYKPGMPTALILECARGKEIPPGCESSIGELVVSASESLHESFISGERRNVE